MKEFGGELIYMGLRLKYRDVEMGTYMGDGEWYISCYHTCVPPKAWCEIPKYTVE